VIALAFAEAGAGVSISGFRASARTPPYGAVKAAILEYIQTTAAQFARKGIRVNCIAPGSIEFPGGTWERAKNSNPTSGRRPAAPHPRPVGRILRIQR
jgi:NAD(P)-dependent dehydrogenase (short-subunit alcohol dehydrogenase family)